MKTNAFRTKPNAESQRSRRDAERNDTFFLRASRSSLRLCVQILHRLYYSAPIILTCLVSAATNDLTSVLQKGLFEEEANHNLEAAAQAYQAVSAQFDKDRKLAATAIFRLGEVYRKQSKTNEAVVQYERIVREFSDQETLATLSRQNLTSLRPHPAMSAGRLMPMDELRSQLEQARMTVAAIDALPKTNRTAALATLFANDEIIETFTKQRDGYAKQLEVLRQSNPEDSSVVKVAKQKIQENQATIDERASKIEKGARTWLEMMEKSLQQREASGLETVESRSPLAIATTDEEEKEIRRIQAMIQNSPDLINAPDAGGTLPLIAAAGRGQLRVAQFLLDNGAGVNRTVANGGTALHAAAENGHKAMVELLLARDAAVNAKDSSLRTALHCAAEKNYRTLAEVLVARNADVNAPDSRGYTPLNLAVEKGHDEFAQLLLEHGAAVNARNQSGQTPLILAAQRGHQTLVAALLAAKADPNVIDSNGRTALSLAANGYVETVKALLDAKADPNGGTSDLPLAVASSREGINIANLLLHAGADPNWEAPVSSFVVNVGMNYSKYTPLQIAVARNRADLARLFFQFKADPKAVRQGSGAPLVWDTFANAELLKAFLDAGADPNAEGGHGQPNPNSLLYMAASVGNAAGVEALLAAGARVNPPADARDPPLNIAAQKADERTIRLLLDAGAEVNRLTRNGYTALWSAVLARRTDVTALLLAHGADPNLRLDNGPTPLHFAVRGEDRPLVQLLLTNKADVNLRDKNGKTPLDLAKEKLAGPRAPGIPPGAVPAGSPPPLSPPRQDSEVQPVSPATLADLLRQHGALDDLPRLDRVEVRRASANVSAVIFTKSPNDWNQFSLLEVVACHYGLITDQRSGEIRPRTAKAADIWRGDALRFPDFKRLTIHRPAADGRSWTTIPVNLAEILSSGDCSRDVMLRWGDVLEIPEADHPVAENWSGLADPDIAALIKCVSRTVTVAINRTNAVLKLSPEYLRVAGDNPLSLGDGKWLGPGNARLSSVSFTLRSALDQSKLVRFSSDLTRVKAARRDVATGQTREWILDCGDPNNAPDLWLRDGDVIEVPDKP